MNYPSAAPSDRYGRRLGTSGECAGVPAPCSVDPVRSLVAG